VVEGIPDPVEEGDRREEVILLSKLIHLWIPIQHSSRDELVEDSDDKRGKDGEEDVVVCHRPTLKSDLSGEVVEPRVLRMRMSEWYQADKGAYPE